MQQPTQEYTFTLKSMLKFELISLYGRIFLQSRKPNFKSHKKMYLNLGCGLNFQQVTGGGA